MFRFLVFMLVITGVVCITYLLAKGGSRVLGYVRTGDTRKELAATKKNLAIAERGLRAIANGAGNPVFEAQVTLDDINANEIKELDR